MPTSNDENFKLGHYLIAGIHSAALRFVLQSTRFARCEAVLAD